MTGSELAMWFDELLYDLGHPADADLFWLLIRLTLFVCGAFLLWNFSKLLLRPVVRALSPLLHFVWRVVSFPFRLPVRLIRAVARPLNNRRAAQRWRREEVERERLRLAEERTRSEATIRQLQELRRSLDE